MRLLAYVCRYYNVLYLCVSRILDSVVLQNIVEHKTPILVLVMICKDLRVTILQVNGSRNIKFVWNNFFQTLRRNSCLHIMEWARTAKLCPGSAMQLAVNQAASKG